MWRFAIVGLLMAGCRDPGKAEPLPVPEREDPLAVKPPPPPPPPPPPRDGDGDVPEALMVFLRAHPEEAPWQVTLVDVSDGKRAALAEAEARELVALLGSRRGWTDGAYGCGSHGIDLRIRRGRGPELVVTVSCGNVELDGGRGALSRQALAWLRARWEAHGMSDP